MWPQLLQQIHGGDIKALARTISLIENEYKGYEELLCLLPGNNNTKIIGITGPPGAGKSTLVDGLVGELVKNNKKVVPISANNKAFIVYRDSILKIISQLDNDFTDEFFPEILKTVVVKTCSVSGGLDLCQTSRAVATAHF